MAQRHFIEAARHAGASEDEREFDEDLKRVAKQKPESIKDKKMRTIVAAALLVIGASAANAHITSTPNSGPANSFFIAHFTVPHGCGHSPTVSLQITMPSGVTEIKPEHKPGWKVQIVKAKANLASKASMDMPGMKMGEEPVSEVIWRGGPLPVSEFESFGLLMKLPAEPGTLYFPTVQQCQKGSTRYTNIPAKGQRWHDVKDPAPFIEVTAPTH